MKKLFTFILVFLAALLFVACQEEHTHKYGEWVVVKEATITEEGSKERVCECGEKQTEKIEKLAHTHEYGEWVVVKEATEAEEGSKERTCSCGEKETEVIAKLEHVHAFGEWVVVKEATETEEGSKERECACGEKETEVIEKLAHTHKFENGSCACGEAHDCVFVDGTCECGNVQVVKFTVVFKDKDGNVLATVEVEEGETAVAPEAPVVEGFEFKGWDKEFDNVASDLEVKAVYEKVVTGSIKIIGKTNIYVGKTTTLRTSIKDVEGDVVWSSSNEEVATVDQAGKVAGVSAGTVTIYATIGEVVGEFEMTIEENPAVVVEGDTQVVIGTPLQLTAKLINVEGEVVWSSKNEAVATVDANGLVTGVSTGKVVIKAEVGTLYCNYVIDVVNPTFTVTFIGYNGEVLEVQEVEKGKDAVPPTVPQKEGLTFKGWDTKYDNVTDDLEIKGIFEKNAYFVTYDFNGGQSEELYIKNGNAVTSFSIDNYNYNNGAFWSGKYASDIFIGNRSNDPGATFSDRIYIATDPNTGFYTIINILMSGPSSWPEGAEYVITISSSYSAYRAHHTKIQALQVGDVVVFDKPIATITKQAPAGVYFYREKPTNNVIEMSVDKNGKLITPAYLGYDFVGWFDEAGKKYESAADLTDDVKLTAKWDALNPVTELNITSMTTELVTGDTFQIVASVVPSDAYFKEILYYTTDEDIVSVSASGLMEAGNAGTVKITITDFMGVIVKEYEVTVYMVTSIDAKFEAGYKGVLNVGDSVKLIPDAVGKGTDEATYTFKSSNEAVATVDAEGNITAKGLGTVTITVNDNIDATDEFSVAVVVAELTENDKVEKVMKLLAENNFATVETGNFGIYNDGTQRYYQANYGSVNKYHFSEYVVNTEFTAQAEAYTGGHKSRRFTGGFDDSIQFVTVHDTATLTGTVRSIASNMSQGETSIHYTTGNDEIYAVVPEKYIAYHAGDGTSTPFTWTATGIKAKEVDHLDFTTYPEFDITGSGNTYYWVIDGQKSNIVAPISNGSKTISNPSKVNLPDLGPTWKIVNGEYYIGNTWVCFSQFAAGTISSFGGNNNSIGIEMCVNVSSDMYDTLQRTAKLVADILIRNNLDLTRVKMHNNWSGKNCPQVLRTGGDYWWNFMEMVKVEYIMMKEYSDVKVEMKSNNPEIVDETGRVFKAPVKTTSVSYELKVSCGDVTKTMTLHNIVPGSTTWSQWTGTYPAKLTWNNGKYSRLA